MFTNPRVSLTLIIVFILVIFRISQNFSTQTNAFQVEIEGEVSSIPYVKYEKLNFRVDKNFVSSEYVAVQVGDKVKVEGEVKDGVIEAGKVQVLEKPGWQKTLSDLRKSLNEVIFDRIPNPQASLLAGVTLGNDQLPKAFKADLITTGTIHVVVVSGYNIALVGGFFLALSPWLGRKKATLLAIAFIVCYAVLVGLSAPTLRATILGIITLFGLLIGRKTLALYSLIMTGMIMVLVNPNFITDISFQLSFLATLGILIFTSLINVRLKRLHPLFRESLATTLAAQILVLPVIFYYFGTISLLSPLVNMLVLWLIPLLTIGGFVFLVLSFLNIISTFFSVLLLVPLTVFTQVIEQFAKLDFLLLELPKNNWFFVVGYYLIISSLLLNQKVKRVRRNLELANET